MFLLAGSTLLFLLCVSPVSAHDPFVLDARRAVPNGVRVELTELPSVPAESNVRYRLQATGLPRGVIFGVFTKDFSHSFHEVASGFQVDESGNLASVDSKVNLRWRLNEMVLKPGAYLKGAAWEVALVSADRAFRAFAKVIPYPITARDGTCTISIELISQRGDRFIVSGNGFMPGEEVTTESRYSGRVIQNHLRISTDGLLPPSNISHGASGVNRAVRYMVKGRSCEVAVDYEWGEPALVRR
jgi:hypothetical protein